MRERKKGRWKAAISALTAIVVLLSLLVFFNLPKPLEIQDSRYDLSQLSDGIYAGSCGNGIIQVQVEVTVRNHTIADIRITQHQNGLGGDAETIVDAVIQRQSVEVDAVSGATMSSQTILKAVENALSKGMKDKQ